jgi:thiol-disulfide isomerase/thioredoxin
LVAGYLKDKVGTEPELLMQAGPLLISATMDVDSSVRELALAALARQNSPELFRLTAELLRDMDPEIRLLGLRYLRKQDAAKALPSVFGLLNDADPKVVAYADSALRYWTKQDFGIRIAQIISGQTEGTNPSLDPENTKTLRDGVQHWKEWWAIHRSDYPTGEPASFERPSAPQRLPLADFVLNDVNGKTVHLTDFKGKAVLLNFWTTWCSACLAELPDLIELQNKHPETLVILGISLDGLPEVDEHGDSGDAHNGDGHESRPDGKTDLKEIRAKVSRVVQENGINYTVLLDPASEAGRRFNGGELPTNVLIDADGYLRRRWLGGRNIATLEALIGNAAVPKTARARDAIAP